MNYQDEKFSIPGDRILPLKAYVNMKHQKQESNPLGCWIPKEVEFVASLNVLFKFRVSMEKEQDCTKWTEKVPWIQIFLSICSQKSGEPFLPTEATAPCLMKLLLPYWELSLEAADTQRDITQFINISVLLLKIIFLRIIYIAAWSSNLPPLLSIKCICYNLLIRSPVDIYLVAFS